jgi:hypothetical protein
MLAVRQQLHRATATFASLCSGTKHAPPEQAKEVLMTRQLLVSTSVLLLVPFGLTGATNREEHEGAGPAHEYAALAAFEQSLQDYVAVQRRLARRTPPLQVTADPARIRTAIDSLGHAIRSERSGAQPGEIFTAPVAEVFRRRIVCALGNFDAAVLLQEMEEDNETEVPQLAVNGRFPWNSGNAIWPSMLVALPQLPEDLEYRFVGADLVLVDVRADLVVDILKGALLSN